MKKLFIRFITKLYLIGHDHAQRNRYNGLRAKYGIHPSFRFNGPGITMYGNGQLHIGARTYVGSHSAINAAEGCQVHIGEGCAISHNVRIYSQSYVADQWFGDVDAREYKFGNVHIGDHVWIGANVLITPGVSIGSNAVIGANSVVTQDIPANAIAAGLPARVLKEKSGQAPTPPNA